MPENRRYIDILILYREWFKLTQNDVEALAKLPKDKYSRIESGKQPADLNDINAIAAIYGQTSSRMLQEEVKFPQRYQLPDQTKDRVISNEKTGIKINTKAKGKLTLVTEHTIIKLYSYSVDDIFLSADIFKKFDIELQNLLQSSSKVTGSLSSKRLSEYVEKAGGDFKTDKRGRNGEYFRLIKVIPAEVLKEAKEKIANAKKKAEKESAENKK